MKTIFKQHQLFPWVLVFTEMIHYLANDAYLPALPLIGQQQGLSQHDVQMTLTAFLFGLTSMQFILGPFADRFPRRRMMLAGISAFILGCLLFAFVHEFSLLLFARFLQGAAATCVIIAGYATVHDIFDDREAIRMLALMGSIIVIAPAFGPVLGAVYLQFSTWESMFILLGLMGIIAWLTSAFLMPETCLHPKKHTLFEILQQYKKLFLHWDFMKPALCQGLLFMIMLAWIAGGPFLTMETFGYSQLSYGLMQGAVFGCYILGSRLLAAGVFKRSSEKIMRLGLWLTFIGCGLSVVLSLTARDYLFDILLAVAITSFGSALAFPIFNRTAIEKSPVAKGISVGTFTGISSCCCFLAPVLVGLFGIKTILQFSLFFFTLSGIVMIMAYSSLIGRLRRQVSRLRRFE